MADRNLQTLNKIQLQTLLRSSGLPVSGTKAELITRLQTPREFGQVIGVELSHLTVPQLKEILKERGLPVSGRKDELVARLQTMPARQPTVAPLPLSPVRTTTVIPPRPLSPVRTTVAPRPLSPVRAPAGAANLLPDDRAFLEKVMVMRTTVLPKLEEMHLMCQQNPACPEEIRRGIEDKLAQARQTVLNAEQILAGTYRV